MKLYKAVFLVLSASVFFLFSCDKVKEPYYKVKGGEDTTTVKRKVLLEDYTGHKCTNCPTAAATAHTLEEAYNGNLIVLAVHAGYFAIPGTGNYALDLTNSTGDEWYSNFGIVSNPIGMVDRKTFAGSRMLTSDLWADTIAKVIATAPDARITISNSFSSSNSTVSTTIKSIFLNAVTGSYTLTVCIMEDSIIGAQKNNDPNVGTTPDITNYVFMHVLRGSINGNYGESLTSEVDTGQIYTKSYNFKLDASWKPKNCWVLAFISNADTREIVQAEKARIIQ